MVLGKLKVSHGVSLIFVGNIIPTTWYKTIVRYNQKPYLNVEVLSTITLKGTTNTTKIYSVEYINKLII